MTKGKLYTIGYQRLYPARLKQIAVGLGALVVDCRSYPHSNRSGFSKRDLDLLLGHEHYTWMGDTLGGKGRKVYKTGLDWINDRLEGISRIHIGNEIAKRHSNPRNLILMCMEEDPGDCHRHHTICSEHFPEARHIFGDEIILARDVDAAIEQHSDEYDVSGSVSLEMKIWSSKHQLQQKG